MKLFEDTEKEYFGLGRKRRRMLFRKLDKAKNIVLKESKNVFLLEDYKKSGIPVLLNHETVVPIIGIFIVLDEDCEEQYELILIAHDYISKSGIEYSSVTTIYEGNLILFMHKNIERWFLEMEEKY